jgi:hypothetical protein
MERESHSQTRGILSQGLVEELHLTNKSTLTLNRESFIRDALTLAWSRLNMS